MNGPTFLTVCRIASIPVIFCGLYSETQSGLILSTIVFMFACMTDYMDGWWARNSNQVTRLGEFLDPIADKLLVGSTLLFLGGFGFLKGHELIPACLIMCREIMVSGLREWLALEQKRMPVSRLAQWKTACQLLAIILLFVGHSDMLGTFYHTCGVAMLYSSAVITLQTALNYTRRYQRLL